MIGRSAFLSVSFAAALLGQGNAPTQAAPPQPPPASPDDVAIIKLTPYRPSIQRDPFSAPRDERPVGAQDLLEDISVKGMIRKDGKNFAIVSDSRGTVRWLPIGHRFKDAEITAITDSSVTFHQWEVNSTNRSVFRTITKTFKREEGKR